jgi:hypothetical protein
MLVVTPTMKAKYDIDGDLALIEEVKDVFRYRGTQQGGHISRQGVKVLEELGSFLVDDNDFEGEEPRRRTVIMPFFGAIHLEMRVPRHLREALRTQAVQSLANAELTPPLSTEAFGDVVFDVRLPGEASQVASDWDPSVFDIPLAEQDLLGDQFLFGNELAQDWGAEMAQWPVNESMWEWR